MWCLENLGLINLIEDYNRWIGLVQEGITAVYWDFSPTAIILTLEGATMSRMIPAAERFTRVRALIQATRDLPIPPETGRYDFPYSAQVKDLLRQTRDLVKFIPYSPMATPAMKAEMNAIFEEADQEILHG
jgi:hypothetical protein